MENGGQEPENGVRPNGRLGSFVVGTGEVWWEERGGRMVLQRQIF